MGVGRGAGGNGVMGDVNGDVKGVVEEVAAAIAGFDSVVVAVIKFLVDLTCSSVFTLLLLLIAFCCCCDGGCWFVAVVFKLALFGVK